MLRIEDFLLAAEAVLETDAKDLIRLTKVPLAESALAAPYASFEGHVFYGHPIQRAAVLCSRIIRNHALPDGNKRVALILMDLHLEEDGYRLSASPPEIDRIFRALASRELTEEDFTAWLAAHVTYKHGRKRVAPLDPAPLPPDDQEHADDEQRQAEDARPADLLLGDSQQAEAVDDHRGHQLAGDDGGGEAADAQRLDRQQ